MKAISIEISKLLNKEELTFELYVKDNKGIGYAELELRYDGNWTIDLFQDRLNTEISYEERMELLRDNSKCYTESRGKLKDAFDDFFNFWLLNERVSFLDSPEQKIFICQNQDSVIEKFKKSDLRYIIVLNEDFNSEIIAKIEDRDKRIVSSLSCPSCMAALAKKNNICKMCGYDFDLDEYETTEIR